MSILDAKRPVSTEVVDLDGDVEIVEPDQPAYVRSAGNVLRVAVAAISFLAALFVSALFRVGISGAEQDVVHLAQTVPQPLAQLLIAAGAYVALIGPFALIIGLFATRKPRVVLMVVVAGLAADGAMYLVSRGLSFAVELPVGLGELRGVNFTSIWYLASASAIVTVVTPWLDVGWRRLATGSVLLIALTRIASNADTPYDVAIAVILGWLVGAVVLLVFGSPNRMPRGGDIAASLREVGYRPRRLEHVGRGVRGTNAYVVDELGGGRWFVKVFSSDQPDADRLVQIYRWFRLRDATTEKPLTELRRSVEHEALLAMSADRAGIPTGGLRTVAEVPPDGMLLAFDYVDGQALAGSGPDGLTDDLLRRVWQLVAALRDNRIAHRDLNLTHILLPRSDEPTLVDWGYAEVAASDLLLRTDIAELLASSAVEVGPERAARAAVGVLGAEAVGDALPRLQKLALSAETRQALGGRDGLLKDLQAAVQQATGVEEVKYEELARVTPRTVVGVVVFAIAIYALLPRLAEVSDIGQTLAKAKWIWIIPLVLSQCLTYVGATTALIGSVPDRLRFFPMLGAQVAASFVDVLAPASIGGMALNTRYLQKKGVDPGVAVAGVGLNAVAGLVAHLLLLGLFLVWASYGGGSDVAGGSTSGVRPPSVAVFIAVAAAMAVIVGLTAALPAGRRLIRKRLIPLARDAVKGFKDLARRPRKLVALVGGSALVTLGFLGALYCAVEAFGGDVSYAGLGVAYLIASTVTIVAPTPGGLGPLEAALIAALGQLGMSADAAVSAVFLFRTGTFWLPVLPGWIWFHVLERRGEI